jgi:phosphoribosyl 1,2-cyclic phosphate phosphodiesterase
MRPYNYYQKSAIPIYSTEYFLDDLTGRFHYAFNPLQKGGGVPQMELEVVEPGERFRAAGVEIMPVEIMHGRLPILGFRIGEFAYLTDCSEIPRETFGLLAGVKTLILDALRWRPHSTHFSVVQALAAAHEIGVERAFFTHIADELEHDYTNALLPAWAQLAWDGLELEVPR